MYAYKFNWHHYAQKKELSWLSQRRESFYSGLIYFLGPYDTQASTFSWVLKFRTQL